MRPFLLLEEATQQSLTLNGGGSRMKKRLMPNVSTLLLMFASTCAFAIDAAKYDVMIPNAKTISVTRDHYSVSFLYGWISTRDSILRRIFSKSKDGTLQVSSGNTFFDGETTSAENVVSLQDISGSINRPIGQSTTIVDNAAGDIDSRLTIKLAVNRDSTISDVVSALESARSSLPADMLSAPWIGYAKAVDAVTKQMFGTNAAEYPIYWTGDVKVNVPTADGFNEHLIVLISPHDDDDQEFRKLQASKLSYSPRDQRVLYDGSQLTDWSYIVLLVSRSDGFNIPQLIFESNAPWAVVASSEFVFSRSSTAKNVEQLEAVADNAVAQLKSEIDLLNKEHRFSRYDRAVALRSFAQRSVEAVKRQCTKLNLTTGQCPTGDLQQFSDNIAGSFGLSADANTAAQLKIDAASVSVKVNEQAAFFRPMMRGG